MKNYIRQTFVVLAALFQVAVPALEALGWGDGFRRNIENQITTPVVPGEPAFAIWGLIFVASFAFAIYQARPTMTHDPLMKRVGWFVGLAFFGNGVWQFVARAGGDHFLLFAILIGIASSAVIAFLRIREAGLHRSEWWLVDAPSALLAGWTTFAAFANLSVALAAAGLGDVPGSAVIQAFILLIAATSLAVALIHRSRSMVFSGVVLWALAWVTISNVVRTEEPAVATLAGLAMVVVLGFSYSRLPSRPKTKEADVALETAFTMR